MANLLERISSRKEEPTPSTGCDVCIKRMKHVTADGLCGDCQLNLCEGCSFVHQNIPACIAHEMSALPPSSNSEDLEHDGPNCDETECEAQPEVGTNLPTLIRKTMFSCTREEDERPATIRAVHVMESGVILVTDWANCSIKAFDKDGHFLGDYFFQPSGADSGRIHDITGKDEKTVFVTLPSLKKIACVVIVRRDNGMKVDFSPVLHKTLRRYFGIAHLPQNKQLVVGTTNAVDTISYTGRRLLSVSNTCGFQNPYNMTSDPASGSVFISDTKSNSLFRMSAQLDVKVFHDEGGSALQLRGVTTDGRGNVFFCGLKSSGIEWMTSHDDGMFMGCVMPRSSNDGDESITKGVGIHFRQVQGENWLVVGQEDGTIKRFSVEWA